MTNVLEYIYYAIPFIYNIRTDFLMCRFIYFCDLKKLVCPPVYELVSVDLLVSEILNEKVPADLPAPKKPSNEAVKVLHITDIHMDPGYLENMPATCNYPICCRNNHPYNETETTS